MNEIFDKLRKDVGDNEFMQETIDRLEKKEIIKQQEIFDNSMKRADELNKEMKEKTIKVVNREGTKHKLKAGGTAIAAGTTVGIVTAKILSILM